MAVNRGGGSLYAVVQDARFSGFRYDTIALTQSTDGGQSWSPLVRINPGSDAGARVDERKAFTPVVHVGDEGTVTVTFYDFRNSTAADGILATDQWAAHCRPRRRTARGRQAGTKRPTPASFDMRQAPFAGGYSPATTRGWGPPAATATPSDRRATSSCPTSRSCPEATR